MSSLAARTEDRRDFDPAISIYLAVSIVEMSPLLSLPAELQIRVIDSVSDLADLNNLLHSSSQLTGVFNSHFRSILKTIISRSINPENPSIVADALQAACSGKQMRCHPQEVETTLSNLYDGFPPSQQNLSNQTWSVSDDKYDIWHLKYRGNPLDVLRTLHKLHIDTKTFRATVQSTQLTGFKRNMRRIARPQPDDLVWELQAWTLRLANLQPIKASTQSDAAIDTLAQATQEWRAGLPRKKALMLNDLIQIGRNQAAELAKYLLHPAPDTLLHRLTFSVEALQAISGLPAHECLRQASALFQIDHEARITDDDRKTYARTLGKRHPADKRSSVVTAQEQLAVYLQRFRPLVQAAWQERVDIVYRIGRYYDGGGCAVWDVERSALDMHLHMAATRNRFNRSKGEGGDGDGLDGLEEELGAMGRGGAGRFECGG